jgi:LysM repeat protein
MTKCAPGWRLLLLVCLAFLLAGCSQFKRSSVAEDKDPHVIEGRYRAKALDYKGAVESFERALQSNPNNSTAHFDLALLWDRQLKDPAAAIYHYQKHLALNTNSTHTGYVRGQVEHLKRELARTHSYAVLNRDAQEHIDRLNAKIKEYEDRIQKLEADAARVPQYITNEVIKYVKLPETSQGPRTLTKPTTIVEAPEPDREEQRMPVPVQRSEPDRTRAQSNGSGNGTRNGTRSESRQPSREAPTQRAQTSTTRTVTHKVKPGDTMAKVAKQYKISVAELKAANPGIGNGTRAGQLLKIPQK